MSERNLLASCIASREAFEAVQHHISKGDISEQGNIILSGVREYYDRDPDVARVDGELLAASVNRGLSNPKHKETFEALIKGMAEQEVSPANVINDFIEVRREAAGARLASALAAGRTAGDIRPLLDDYSRWDGTDALIKQDEEILNGVGAAEMAASYSTEGLIGIWPKSLNDRLDGGLLPGHHLLIFARPEMGKTLMLVNMMAGFCAQGKRTLYVGNEEPIKETMMRVLSRLTGMSRVEILEDIALADDVAIEKGYDNLYFKEASPGTPRQIEQWIREVEPEVLVIDQLRNLNVNEEQFVQKLEKAAMAVREIGKKHGLVVVSVTQAGDSASGKGPLDMGDVDSSNTGIPAACDVMVGMGATTNDVEGNRRILSLPKNKRSGKHEYFPVRIEPLISNVRSIS